MPFTKENAKELGRAGGKNRKGTKSPATIEKEKVAAAVKAQILKVADKLIHSQTVSAFGTHKVVVLTKEDGIMKVETVRDIDRIEKLFAEGVYGKDYLIVAGKEPDWKAADALLNRALGKATENIDVKTGGEKVAGFTYVIPKEKEDDN